MNHYKTLNLPESATAIEIKKRYRELALSLHPDRNKSADAPEKFRAATEAYQVLRDAETRRIYDLKLKQQRQPQSIPQPEKVVNQALEKFLKLLFRGQSFFSGLFNDDFYYKNLKKAPDTYVEVPITYAEMIRGGTKTVQYQIQILCPYCEGEQAFKIFAFGCSCNGTGLFNLEKTANIKFPAGVLPGQEMRKKGKGTSGRDMIEDGDLVFEIVEADTEAYANRWHDGLNIHQKKEIGTAKKTQVDIGTGTYTFATDKPVHVLAGKGLFNRSTGERGHFYVHLHKQGSFYTIT